MTCQKCPKTCQVFYLSVFGQGSLIPGVTYTFKLSDGTTVFDISQVATALGTIDLSAMVDAINAASVNFTATLVSPTLIKVVFHLPCDLLSTITAVEGATNITTPPWLLIKKLKK